MKHLPINVFSIFITFLSRSLGENEYKKSYWIFEHRKISKLALEITENIILTMASFDCYWNYCLYEFSLQKRKTI